MKRIVIAAATALPLLGGVSAPALAQAQMPCGRVADMRANLGKQYSEVPVSIGLSNTGSIIEIFASPEGTFSLVMTLPNGLSCMMAAGNNWERLNTLTSNTKAKPAT